MQIRKWLLLIIVWFRRIFFVATPVAEPEAPLPSSEPMPAPVEEPPLPSELPPPPVESAIIVRPAKWVKPKGEKPKAESRPKPDSKPKAESKPKAPRPQLRTEDPEQWGQYYFRDAILDQLDTYFTYLKRMRVNDRNAYDLHSRLGIHILPQSAVQSFDNWRHAQDEDELSAWWKSHRPSFGAVSYGIDADSLREDRIKTCDLSPEQWDQIGGRNHNNDLKARHRIVTVTGGPDTVLPDGHHYETGMIWVPKFLYFSKWKKPPADVQKVTGGDVYSMTIYWDRVAGNRAIANCGQARRHDRRGKDLMVLKRLLLVSALLLPNVALAQPICV